MIAGRASLTAAAVALARGDRPPSNLLPEPLGAGARLVERCDGLARWGAPLLRAGSLGLVDHIGLRTAAIDAAIAAATADGIAQLVLLGAGLDARAWRMPELARTTVIEVDHASTQAVKRAWLGAVTPRARTVQLLPVDFERQTLAAALAATPFDRQARTMWIWEGVVMYLTPAAMRATLADVSRLSAPGSVLAVTYAQPELGLPLGLRQAARGLLAALGEPLAGALSTEELRATLAEHGFALRSDTGSQEWAQAVGRRALPARLFAGERLAVVQRQ